MNDRLNQQSCVAFTELLASRAPVPGGGGAAALVGALGVSLGAMAANLTIGKKKYAEYEEELRDIIRSCENLRLRLMELVDLDAEAFEPLSRAYALPKDTPGYTDIMRESTLRAADAPYRMVLACCESITLLEHLEPMTSRLLISDIACGAALSRAALEAASINVSVNTRLLRGDPEADALETDTKERLEQYGTIADRIVQNIRTTLLDN